MSVKEWKDKYIQFIELADELNNSCPFLNDDDMYCDGCPIDKQCMTVCNMRRIVILD